MSGADPLLERLAGFKREGVQYVLIGGQAVRLNGFLRATEDVDSVAIRVLNIDGLLRTKSDVREKDRLDRRMLERIRSGLGAED